MLTDPEVDQCVEMTTVVILVEDLNPTFTQPLGYTEDVNENAPEGTPVITVSYLFILLSVIAVVTHLPGGATSVLWMVGCISH